MTGTRKTPHRQFCEAGRHARQPPRDRPQPRIWFADPVNPTCSLTDQGIIGRMTAVHHQKKRRERERGKRAMEIGERRKCGNWTGQASFPHFLLARSPGRRPSGAEGIRTLDPRLAKPMLSQLSYGPWEGTCEPVGGNRFGRPVDRISEVGARRVELRTSSLSATRSNQLSYAPSSTKNAQVALRRLIVDFPVQLSNGAQIELVVETDFVLSLSAAACRGAAGISPRPGRGVRGT